MSSYNPTILTNFGQGNDFGHADYQEARKAGISNDFILNYLKDNPNKLEGKNVIGGGGLYDEISKMGKGRNHNEKVEAERQHSTEHGWIGNKNTYDEEAGYPTLSSPEYIKAENQVNDYKEKLYRGDFLKGDSNGWWDDTDKTTESNVTSPITPNSTETNDVRKSYITKRNPEGFMRDFMKDFKFNKD